MTTVLCGATQSTSQDVYDHFFAVDSLITDRFFYSAHGTPYLAPLYLYGEEAARTLFDTEDIAIRRPNLNPDFVREMEGRLGLSFITDGTGDLETEFGPEDVFCYIYAVFHSPTYRERYAEFLRIDFPRVPLTSNPALFRALVRKGAELVEYHLLRNVGLRDLTTTFPVKGSGQVVPGHPRYVEPGGEIEQGRVYINAEQYFEGIEPEVWDFHIGGYQVLDKWLKDRRGRTLSADEITHYQKVVVALRETIRLMEEIDAAIPSWPIT